MLWIPVTDTLRNGTLKNLVINQNVFWNAIMMWNGYLMAYLITTEEKKNESSHGKLSEPTLYKQETSVIMNYGVTHH